MGTPASSRAILFDIDGVLINMKFPSVLPVTLGISPNAANEFFDGPFKACLLGKRDLRDILPSYLLKWGWKRSFDDFLAFWFDIESQLHLPTLALADRLRASSRRCFLVSTQEQYRARHLEALLGLGDRFDGAFFSCRLGCQKPDPTFYLAVAGAIGLQPSELCLIDDNSGNVLGAKALGWNALLYQIGDDLDDLSRSLGLKPYSA